MNTEIVYDKICFFRNALPNPKEWLEKVELANDEVISEWVPWQSNPSNGSIPYVYGDRKYLSILKSESDLINTESKILVRQVIDAMVECAEEYSKIYSIDIPIDLGAACVLNKYKEHEVMGQHADWNQDQDLLEYSFVVYINDDYEGGELYFKDLDVTIKPEAGSIALFPSKLPYSHGSTELTMGRKVFIPHFWRRPPKSS